MLRPSAIAHMRILICEPPYVASSIAPNVQNLPIRAANPKRVPPIKPTKAESSFPPRVLNIKLSYHILATVLRIYKTNKWEHLSLIF